MPGIRPELFDKAARSAADIIFLDLEDSVSPADKETARHNVIAGLRATDWRGKTVSVRVNGPDTPYMYRDVIDVVEEIADSLERSSKALIGIVRLKSQDEYTYLHSVAVCALRQAP